MREYSDDPNKFNKHREKAMVVNRVAIEQFEEIDPFGQFAQKAPSVRGTGAGGVQQPASKGRRT